MKRFTIPDHNRLQATMDQLEADGHNNQAAKYRKRYEDAQAAYNSLVELGRHVDVIASITPYYQRGTEIAQFLVEAGWTPPEPMGVDVTADAVEVETAS
ncbi:hypothetical protein [Gordonia rubripertincta]|uniref:hypothetical protein n=1 Tax=Gordonia rubripertincta TaxID=36822 RepID=UPI0015F8BBCB|nr:hypothetical protein [Gordonia rubripertincta]QMU19029.1 hypothetical protein H3V45_13005 [Gordonia rubripertincta]